MPTRHRIAEIHDGALVRTIYDGYSQRQAGQAYAQARSLGVRFPHRVAWTKNGTLYKLLTFPYRDFSEYACGLADDTS
jgi:hypothetical protein